MRQFHSTSSWHWLLNQLIAPTPCKDFLYNPTRPGLLLFFSPLASIFAAHNAFSPNSSFALLFKSYRQISTLSPHCEITSSPQTKSAPTSFRSPNPGPMFQCSPSRKKSTAYFQHIRHKHPYSVIYFYSYTDPTKF